MNRDPNPVKPPPIPSESTNTVRFYPRQPSMTVGEQIKRLRKARQWTQDTLEIQANMPHRSLSPYECGKVEPTLSTLRLIARAFGMTLSQLLDGVK